MGSVHMVRKIGDYNGYWTHFAEKLVTFLKRDVGLESSPSILTLSDRQKTLAELDRRFPKSYILTTILNTAQSTERQHLNEMGWKFHTVGGLYVYSIYTGQLYKKLVEVLNSTPQEQFKIGDTVEVKVCMNLPSWIKEGMKGVVRRIPKNSYYSSVGVWFPGYQRTHGNTLHGTVVGGGAYIPSKQLERVSTRNETKRKAA